MPTRRDETLTISIGARISEALKGIDQLGSRVGKFGKSVERTGRSLARNFTAPIAAAGAAAAALGVRVGNLADELFDLEQQTGLSTDTLQEFRRVTSVAGVEQDALARAAQQLTMRLSRGEEGSADLRRAMDELGISMRDAAGNLRPMDELVGEAVTRLSDMEDQTRRNVLATQIFSRSAEDLMPVLGMGSAEIERLRQEARDLGLVLDREALEAADAFRQQWQTLRDVLSASVSQIGLALIPVLSELAEIVQERIVPQVQRAVGWFGEWTKSADMLKIALVGLTVAGIGPLIVGIGRLITIFGALLTKTNLIIAGIAALAATAVWAVSRWDEARLGFAVIWRKMVGYALDAVDAILGGLERLWGWVPILGNNLREARRQFDEFAAKTLWKLDYGIAKMVVGLSAAGEAVEDLGEAIEETGRATGRAAGGLAALTGWADDFEPKLAGVNREWRKLPEMLERMPDVLDDVGDKAEDALGRLEQFGVETAVGLGDAFADFATGSKRAIGDFVSFALRQLARLLARMAVVKALTAVGGPGIGKFAGFFAGGGHIPRGQFGLVAEAGRPEIVSKPSFVQGPAQVTPTGGGAAAVHVHVPPAQDPLTLSHDQRWMYALRQMADILKDHGYRFEGGG